MLDGGNCGIGLESTVVDTTSAVPTILRPGGITYEMLTEVMGAVEIDPALQGDKNFKPKAPGMKYRHYAPKAPVYLFEGEACKCLPQVIAKALAEGKTVGVLCGHQLESELAELVESSSCSFPAGVTAVNSWLLICSTCCVILTVPVRTLFSPKAWRRTAWDWQS